MLTHAEPPGKCIYIYIYLFSKYIRLFVFSEGREREAHKFHPVIVTSFTACPRKDRGLFLFGAIFYGQSLYLSGGCNVFYPPPPPVAICTMRTLVHLCFSQPRALGFYRGQAYRAASSGVSVDVHCFASKSCNHFGLSSIAPLAMTTGGGLFRCVVCSQWNINLRAARGVVTSNGFFFDFFFLVSYLCFCFWDVIFMGQDFFCKRHYLSRAPPIDEPVFH